MTVLTGFLVFVGNLLPDIELPEGVAGFASFIEPAWLVINGMGGWIAVSTIGLCVAWMIGLQGIIVGIRVIRVVVSLFTGGGGSAA